MKTLTETLNSSINERMLYRDLYSVLEYHVTEAIKAAWDELGIDLTHADIKEALDKLAKDYDVDKQIDWAKKYIK